MRLDHAPGIGQILPGDIEGRAVVRRSPDERQAQGDVDPGVESVQLERDQPLVVVKGDDDPSAAARRPPKDDVGRDAGR